MLKLIHKQTQHGKSSPVRAVTFFLLGLSLIIISGGFYRHQLEKISLAASKKPSLKKNLASFPMIKGQWEGSDVEISENILRIAGSDDYLNRLYIDKDTPKWVMLYIAYSSRPRSMIGHKPQACYVGNGWVHDYTDKYHFSTLQNGEVEYLIHRFHKPSPNSEQITVVNYYIINGKISCDEDVFSGLGWRSPNLNGDPAHYVAQVQISSALENSAIAFARIFTDQILDHFNNNFAQKTPE
ncbi:MAG: exosortase-associated EpsI family protein [Planctomycetes bacterium]|nr:exosortase-associated EpsI family protein [Planctomycetota bacterium]MBL7106279.1 exosortase-associated EpsI family protein [Phycisphaerae bacterium]